MNESSGKAERGKRTGQEGGGRRRARASERRRRLEKEREGERESEGEGVGARRETREALEFFCHYSRGLESWWATGQWRPRSRTRSGMLPFFSTLRPRPTGSRRGR
eukprot:scaffold180732_cov23-Tisochrysis_lutea.AAC.1